MVLGGDADAASAGMLVLSDIQPDWTPVRLRRRGDIQEMLASAREALAVPAGLAEYLAQREAVFHPQTFDPNAAVLSPCESVYVAEDPDWHADSLSGMYAASGFTPRIALKRCCPGHIAVELEFYAHCLRVGSSGGLLMQPEIARSFLEAHLLRWALLFAAVLFSSEWHAVLRMAGLALDSFLICEAEECRRLSESASMRADDGTVMPSQLRP